MNATKTELLRKRLVRKHFVKLLRRPQYQVPETEFIPTL